MIIIPLLPALPPLLLQIKDQLPKPANGTPILVFWKQQPRKNSVPFNPEVAKTVKPKTCDTNPGKCNDTYVLSLVAYYQIKETDSTSIWCQPSGDPCPTRIARYEITDGIKNPDATSIADIYYSDTDTKDTQQRDPAFSKEFDFTKPTEKVTDPTGLTDLKSGATKPQVLVNYIDHSTANVPVPTEPQAITDGSTYSFYAIVDTSKNIATVTIRGNSLRRLQADKADFKTTSSAFFPITTVQVKGLGAVGK